MISLPAGEWMIDNLELHELFGQDQTRRYRSRSKN